MTEITLAEIDRLHADKMVTVRRHPYLPLRIINYTPAVQWDKLWTPTLLQCRGLIMDDDGSIIARPFPKFFNLGEHESSEIPDEPFEVWEKMDGSLGILFNYEGVWHISSRGSFDSEQAIKASEMLAYYSTDLLNLTPFWTYMVEIIYPENRIVVNYGRSERLVMLGANATKGTHYSHPSKIFWPDKPRFYDKIADLAAMEDLENKDDEGFVVTFESGMKLKYKFSEYLRLHRIMTEASNVSVWEAMKDGVSLAHIIEDVPDEFYNWLQSTMNEFTDGYSAIVISSMDTISKINGMESRKEQADAIKLNPYKAVIFAMLDGNKEKASRTIWQLIKPQYKKAIIFSEEEKQCE